MFAEMSISFCRYSCNLDCRNPLDDQDRDILLVASYIGVIRRKLSFLASRRPLPIEVIEAARHTDHVLRLLCAVEDSQCLLKPCGCRLN